MTKTPTVPEHGQDTDLQPALPEQARMVQRQQQFGLERRHQLLLALGHAAQVVLQARSPDAIYRAIGDQLRRLKISVTVFALAPDRMSMTLTYMSWDPKLTRVALGLAGLSEPGIRIPLAPDGLFASLIAGGDSFFSERTADIVVRGFPHLGRAVVDGLLALIGAEQSAYAPLVQDGETKGILAFVGTDLTPADLPAVSAFAAQASIALENARLLAALKDSRERMRRVAQQAIAAQEEELRHLSQAIHDGTAQRLTSLHIRLELIAEEMPDELASLQQRLTQAAEATGQIAGQLRTMIEHLRPPVLDALGLGASLKGLCKDWEGKSPLTVECSGTAPPTLSGAVESTLYRFLSEALYNVVGYAEATRVQVELRVEQDTISLTVEDDGKQRDVAIRLVAPGVTGGVGLLGVRERLEVLGGSLEYEPLPGGGTRLAAHIPL